MHVILFGLGLILSAAGLAVAAYGLREIEFTIGTTLILAGTVAGTGGLLLIGFAATVHQLRRIAGIQTPQAMREVDAEPQLASPARGAAAPVPAPARIPFPPRPQPAEPKPSRESARAPEPRALDPRAHESRAPEPHVPEPRLTEPELGPAPDPIFGDMLSQASTEYPPESRIEPRIEPRAPEPAPHVTAPHVAAQQRPVEPPMVEDEDEVPLSPRPPAKVQLRHSPAPPLTRTRPTNATNGSAAPSSTAPSSVAETRAEATDPGADESGQPPVNFDSLWPAEKRPGRSPREAARATPAAPAAPFVERRGEAAARRDVVRPEPPRRNEEAAQVRAEAPRIEPARSEPTRGPSGRAEPPALRVEPVARVEPAPVRAEPYVPGTEPPALRIESEQPPAVAKPPEPPRAVAILKSGVVDGMAYTLYADGSIEAQLSGGTVRFGSIAELREHIEKNS